MGLAALGAWVFFGTSQEVGFAVLACLAIVPTSLQTFLAVLFNVFGKVRELVFSRVGERVVFLALVIVTVSLHWRVAGALLAGVLSMLVALAYVLWRTRPLASLQMRLGGLRHPLYFQAGLFFTSTILIFAFGRFTVFLTSRLFGPTDVGQFGVAFSISEAGSLVIGQVMLAFFPFMSRRLHRGPMPFGRMLSYTGAFAGLGFIGSAVGFFLAPLLIPFLFGQQYLPAVPLFQILVWGFWFSAATVPASLAADVTFTQKVHIMNALYMAPLNIVLILVLKPYLGIQAAAFGTTLAKMSGMLIGIPLILFHLHRKGVVSTAQPNART
jgi:PST family polysaccharide transporter